MEYTIDDQTLERLRKKCRLRLALIIILAVVVYFVALYFIIWYYFLGSPEFRTGTDAPLLEKIIAAPIIKLDEVFKPV